MAELCKITQLPPITDGDEAGPTEGMNAHVLRSALAEHF